MKMNKPVIKKIKFTKAELDEIDKINKGEPVPKTKIITTKNGNTYQFTSNKRFSYGVARNRLLELYGGFCTTCRNWPSYKVSYDVSDANQGAWLVHLYCQSCFDKWSDTTKWKIQKS